MKYLMILFISLSLSANDVIDHQMVDFIDESTLNWRISPSHDKFIYSSRLRLIKIDNLSASVIYWYEMKYEGNSELSTYKHTSFIINYKY